MALGHSVRTRREALDANVPPEHLATPILLVKETLKQSSAQLVSHVLEESFVHRASVYVRGQSHGLNEGGHRGENSRGDGEVYGESG